MSESCGQCECCAAWRAGRDRLTRERDERVLKSDYNSMVRLLNKAEHERDRLRALLRKAVAIIHRKAQDYPGVTIAEVRELEAALEGRDE